MLHASTSPFYPLFASLDVGAQMMKGRSGEVLWDDTVRLGIELRKKMRAIRREFEEKEQRPGAALVLRALRARRCRPRRDGAPSVPWEDVADRRARLRPALLGAARRAPAGTASATWRRALR